MSYNRFKKTFVWIAASSYKGAIRIALGLTLAMTFMYSKCLGMEEYHGEVWLREQMTGTLAVTLQMFLVAMAVSAANIAKDMQTNDGRVMTLMLPAGNGEKFLARMLWILVSSFGAMIVASVCADILRVLLSYAFRWDIHASMFGYLITNGGDMRVMEFLQRCLGGIPQIIIMTICAHSFFTLGGTLFRRQALLFTFIISSVLTILVGMALATIARHFPGLLVNTVGWFMSAANSSVGWVRFVSILVIIAFTVFDYWAAYKLCCRTQVISNKWINL